MFYAPAFESNASLASRALHIGVHTGLQDRTATLDPEDVRLTEEAIAQALARHADLPSVELVVTSPDYALEYKPFGPTIVVVTGYCEQPDDLEGCLEWVNTYAGSLGRAVCSVRFFALTLHTNRPRWVVLRDGDKMADPKTLYEFIRVNTWPGLVSATQDATVINAGCVAGMAGAVSREQYETLLKYADQYGADEYLPTVLPWGCLTLPADVICPQRGALCPIGDATVDYRGTRCRIQNGRQIDIANFVAMVKAGATCADLVGLAGYNKPIVARFTTPSSFVSFMSHTEPTGADMELVGDSLVTAGAELANARQYLQTVVASLPERYKIFHGDGRGLLPWTRSQTGWHLACGARFRTAEEVIAACNLIGQDFVAGEHLRAPPCGTPEDLAIAWAGCVRAGRAAGASPFFSPELAVRRPSPRAAADARFKGRPVIGGWWRPYEASWGARSLNDGKYVQHVAPQARTWVNPSPYSLPDLKGLAAWSPGTGDEVIGVISCGEWPNYLALRAAAPHIRYWVIFTERRLAGVEGPDTFVVRCRWHAGSGFIFQGLRILPFIFGNPGRIYQVVNDPETVDMPLAYRHAAGIAALAHASINAISMAEWNPCPFQDLCGYGNALWRDRKLLCDRIANIGWIYGADEFILSMVGVNTVTLKSEGVWWDLPVGPVPLTRGLMGKPSLRVRHKPRPQGRVAGFGLSIGELFRLQLHPVIAEPLIIFTFGTRGDRVPLEYGQRLLTRAGQIVLMVHLISITEAEKMLAAVERSEAYKNLPDVAKAAAVVIACRFPNLCPDYLWGGPKSALFNLRPSWKCARRGGTGLPQPFDFMIRWLVPQQVTTWHIGAYRGSLARSADGVQPIPPVPVPYGRWGRLPMPKRKFKVGFAGGSSTITRADIPVIPRGDHPTLFRDYETIVCAGGAGVVQTAAMAGCRVEAIDSSIDRDYYHPLDAGRRVTGNSSGVHWLVFLNYTPLGVAAKRRLGWITWRGTLSFPIFKLAWQCAILASNIFRGTSIELHVDPWMVVASFVRGVPSQWRTIIAGLLAYAATRKHVPLGQAIRISLSAIWFLATHAAVSVITWFFPYAGVALGLQLFFIHQWGPIVADHMARGVRGGMEFTGANHDGIVLTLRKQWGIPYTHSDIWLADEKRILGVQLDGAVRAGVTSTVKTTRPPGFYLFLPVAINRDVIERYGSPQYGPLANCHTLAVGASTWTMLWGMPIAAAIMAVNVTQATIFIGAWWVGTTFIWNKARPFLKMAGVEL